MNNDTILKVENVSKKFCKSIHHIMKYGTVDTAKDFFGIQVDSSQLREGEFWAVENISFEVKRGETLGIIGVNGSGKSTMLKMLNGIFMPDKGKITINGRVGALIEVGAGFHPMLTGRENIYINGSILGLSKKQIDQKYKEIITFADIGDFIDAPVKNYSSGMRVRLGVAVAVNINPEVLLVDEVLSVGDLSFQNKSLKKLGEVRKNANAVIFVSHSLSHIRTLCSKILILDKGKFVFYGSTEEGLNVYHKLIEQVVSKSQRHETGNFSSSDFTIKSIKAVNHNENEVESLTTDDDIIIIVDFSSRISIKKATFGLAIRNQKNEVCIFQESRYLREPLQVNQNVFYRLKITFTRPMLVAGVYKLSFTIRNQETNETYERILDSNLYFSIEGNSAKRGMIACNSIWDLRKIDEN